LPSDAPNIKGDTLIVPSDKSYKQTKKIKLGKATMKPEFRELAEWIDQTYHVKTLNIIYETIDHGERSRLEICVESHANYRKLFGRKFYNSNSETEAAIIEKFKQTLRGKALKNICLTEKIFTFYAAFEPIAQDEANMNISKEKIEELKKSINNKDLWEISRFSSRTTFFVFTDKQLKKYEKSKARKEWANQYFDLLEPYNEFGYFKRDKFTIELDSKENFDNNYKSSWYYYYH